MKIMKKRTFKVDIVFVFIILIVITVMTITSFSYFKNKSSILQLVKLNFTNEADAVLNKTDHYLKGAQSFTEIAANVFSDPELKLSLNSKEAAFLLKTVMTQRQIELFYFADEQGNFLQAATIENKNYTKYIQQIKNKAVTEFNYFDRNLKYISHKSNPDSHYDPRSRPWYRGAKTTGKIFWTKPYIFFETGKPGITVSCPVYKPDKSLKGVVAADITLEGLSEFIKAVDISQHSIAFIIDGNEKMLAFSKPEKIKDSLSGKASFLMAHEFKIPELTAGIRLYQDTNRKLFPFKVKKSQYWACFANFSGKFGENWILGVIAPEDDFLGSMKDTMSISLLLSLSGLLIAVLAAFFLARQISRPIEKLASEIMKIKNFNLEETECIKSHIHEIQEINTAVNAMRNSLKAFKLYVPATLVKQLIDSGEKATIGGKERQLTVLFSDIEDFTTISENISPKELMLQLSDYFDIITKLIEEESGTVDKFIGDAVMAFWGAPVNNENHAISACRAALKCQKTISKINDRWQAEGKYPFHTRMGINTGYMIVGNMGSKQRMNYSVMGDGVNLASRLEGLNRIYSTSIIISKGTHRFIHNHFITRIIDQITVKGKSESVVIYELMAESGTPDAEKLAPLAQRFQAVYSIYLERKWQQAKKQFEDIIDDFPDEQLSKMYIKRCEQFMLNEPAPSWSGISKLFEK